MLALAPAVQCPARLVVKSQAEEIHLATRIANVKSFVGPQPAQCGSTHFTRTVPEAAGNSFGSPNYGETQASARLFTSIYILQTLHSADAAVSPAPRGYSEVASCDDLLASWPSTFSYGPWAPSDAWLNT